MEISFDPNKRAANLLKHGLDLIDAGVVLSARCVDVYDDRYDYGEDRWLSIGLLAGEIVACVWADWPGVARVISLRRQQRMSDKSIYGKRVNRQEAFDGEVGELPPEFFRAGRVRDGDRIVREATHAATRERPVPSSLSGKVRRVIPLSPEVLEHFRATGPGWQRRIDETLLRHVREARTG